MIGLLEFIMPMSTEECPLMKKNCANNDNNKENEGVHTVPEKSSCSSANINDSFATLNKTIPSTLNPANNMPSAEYLQQINQNNDPLAETLSAAREASTIPKADITADTNDTNWQYPSPRMFYNALLRKKKSVPPEFIQDMLMVHNQLNESVWNEIVSRERILSPQCTPKLKRFLGRPEDLSPRAWWHIKVRGGEPPFDRHDWVIDRCGREVRYVIDYYSGHHIPGEASFSVDIRPAIDSTMTALDRFKLFYHKFTTGQQL